MAEAQGMVAELLSWADAQRKAGEEEEGREEESLLRRAAELQRVPEEKGRQIALLQVLRLASCALHGPARQLTLAAKCLRAAGCWVRRWHTALLRRRCCLPEVGCWLWFGKGGEARRADFESACGRWKFFTAWTELRADVV